jgi:hypothetical protein
MNSSQMRTITPAKLAPKLTATSAAGKRDIAFTIHGKPQTWIEIYSLRRHLFQKIIL